MSALLDQRVLLGMSQAHVAFLLGSKQPNISAYETQDAEYGSLVADRVEAFCQLEVETIHRGTWLGTCASHAQQLRAWVKSFTGAEDERDHFLLRYIINMNDAFMQALEHGAPSADLAFFLIPPGSTGDESIDALFAGLGVHWARVMGAERSPHWTRGGAVDAMWWPGLPESAPTLRAEAFVHAVPSLKARGIIVNRNTLASV